jgi:putative nucleotidyltransferase with HDIG domain
MKRIIFVDDDVNIGQGIKRMLHPMRNEWAMVFCTSGEEALATFEDMGTFDIIVSDMHMSGMGGYELLKTVLEKYPETIRFCLSGSASAKTMIKTAAIVHQFLTKPCDPLHLLGLIIRAFELRDKLSDKRIQSILMDVGGVPSVPAIYNQIKRAMEDPDVSVQMVAELIEIDAGLSSKILQIVNTADMGLAQRVTNVIQAATLLGLENIRNLVLMAEVFQPADVSTMPDNFNLDTLWNHCLQVAKYAKKVAEIQSIDKKIAEDSFTAGLLHDIGQIILANKRPDDFGRAIRESIEEQIPLLDKEKEILGATHAEIGGLLLELWGLPDPIVEAITFHNDPSLSSQAEFSALTTLHVANYFCEDKDSDIVVDAQGIDTVHLEEIGLLSQLEKWYDICHEEEDELEMYR